MADTGSSGNVIAALASFVVPGLGQLFQGRLSTAIIHFVADVALWVITLGWLGWPMHLFSAFDAARHVPSKP